LIVVSTSFQLDAHAWQRTCLWIIAVGNGQTPKPITNQAMHESLPNPFRSQTAVGTIQFRQTYSKEF